METTRIKQGASVTIAGDYAENGEAVDLTDYTIASQVRDSGGALVETLVVTKADDQAGTGKGRFTLEPVLNPPEWPVDSLRCDVRITDAAGTVRPFPTFAIVVDPRVTV